MDVIKLVSFIMCLSYVSTQKQYRIENTADGFSVKVGNITVLEHSLTSPMMSVGQGQTTFQPFVGNWRIDDHVTEKIELRNYTMQHDSTSDTIIFTGDMYMVNMKLETNTNQSLVITLTNKGSDYQYTWIRIKATPTEKVWGGGEQFSHFNLRERSYGYPQIFSVLHPSDQTYPMWTREQGVGRNKSNLITFYADQKTGGGGAYHTTYFPQPTFVSNRRYYFHYTGYNYVVMDFSNQNYHEVTFYGKVEQFYFTTGSSLMGVVKSLSMSLGTMPALPAWVTDGMILGVQGGTDVMMQRYKNATDQGVAINGLWIQDWAGELKTSFGSRLFWNWKWNEQRYPNLKTKISDLKTKGVRVLAYINPHLNILGDIYKGVSSKGYFIKKKDNTDCIIDFGEFKCATVDLTNPAAYNWYKSLIQTNMVDLGLGGWMADFGEYTPVDAVFHNGTGSTIHNQYPVLWAKLNREAINERGKTGDVVFWMRAGYSGTSQYTTLMWAGDQNVDFDYADGVASTVISALSMGMSGTGMTHFDIGGYTTFGSLGLRRSPEVLLRSAEMAVFTPVMRTHEGNQPTFNAQAYSSVTLLQQFQRLTNLYTMLKNYTNDAISQYTNTGVPVQRSLAIMFENDPIAQGVKFQYMYGQDLLVSPVIEANVTSAKVYLPDVHVTWIYLWNNTEYNGGQFITVPSPIGLMPVFYRKDSKYTDTFVLMSKQKPIIPPVTSAPRTPTTVSPCNPNINSGTIQKHAYSLKLAPIFIIILSLYSYL